MSEQDQLRERITELERQMNGSQGLVAQFAGFRAEMKGVIKYQRLLLFVFAGYGAIDKGWPFLKGVVAIIGS
jgi:hypothetical protein